MANAYRKEQMKLYMRDRRANLKAIQDPLKTLIHSGITVKMETRDGVLGLYAGAKFTQAQLDALDELALMEHTDAETMVEDMLHQALLEWRRQRDERKKGENTMTLEELDQKAGEYKEWAAETRGDLLKERDELERGVEAGKWAAEQELKDHYAKYGDLDEEEEEVK